MHNEKVLDLLIVDNVARIGDVDTLTGVRGALAQEEKQ